MSRLGRMGALALAALALNGCAFALSALGSTAGSGAGMGMQHNVTGVVSKTYTAPLPELRTAMLTTLERMGVGVADDKQTEEGWVITGKAQDRDISLRLQELTPNTTRARVSVDNDALFKDTATAEEILTQTSRALDEAAAAQIEAEYASKKPAAKKMGAGPLPRASAKSAAVKPPPSQASTTKVAVVQDSAGATPDSGATALPLPQKPRQKVALVKEHM